MNKHFISIQESFDILEGKGVIIPEGRKSDFDNNKRFKGSYNKKMQLKDLKIIYEEAEEMKEGKKHVGYLVTSFKEQIVPRQDGRRTGNNRRIYLSSMLLLLLDSIYSNKDMEEYKTTNMLLKDYDLISEKLYALRTSRGITENVMKIFETREEVYTNESLFLEYREKMRKISQFTYEAGIFDLNKQLKKLKELSLITLSEKLMLQIRYTFGDKKKVENKKKDIFFNIDIDLVSHYKEMYLDIEDRLLNDEELQKKLMVNTRIRKNRLGDTNQTIYFTELSLEINRNIELKKYIEQEIMSSLDSQDRDIVEFKINYDYKMYKVMPKNKNKNLVFNILMNEIYSSNEAEEKKEEYNIDSVLFMEKTYDEYVESLIRHSTLAYIKRFQEYYSYHIYVKITSKNRQSITYSGMRDSFIKGGIKKYPKEKYYTVSPSSMFFRNSLEDSELVINTNLFNTIMKIGFNKQPNLFFEIDEYILKNVISNTERKEIEDIIDLRGESVKKRKISKCEPIEIEMFMEDHNLKF